MAFLLLANGGGDRGGDGSTRGGVLSGEGASSRGEIALGGNVCGRGADDDRDLPAISQTDRAGIAFEATAPDEERDRCPWSTEAADTRATQPNWPSRFGVTVADSV